MKIARMIVAVAATAFLTAGATTAMAGDMRMGHRDGMMTGRSVMHRHMMMHHHYHHHMMMHRHMMHHMHHDM